MADRFAGSEIAELAVQIEINGRDFYKALSEKSKIKRVKDVFKYLAGEEEKHIRAFQKILDSVKKYVPKEAYPQEYFAYMSSLASGYIFTQKDKGKKIARDAKDEKEAIGLGAGFEKDSINFYTEMKEIVPGRDKKIIDELIDEEKDHLKELTDLKESL